MSDADSNSSISEFLFDVARHEEYGTMGVRPRWYPNGDPLEGMAAAHDVLEHFPNDSGDTEGELMALGAALWLRGDGGYWDMSIAREKDPAVHVASDFWMLWDLHQQRNAGAVRDVGQPVTVEPIAARVVALGMENLRNESEGDEDYIFPAEQDQQRMREWLSLGYAKSQERYSGHTSDEMARLFVEIERRINVLLRKAGDDDGEFGFTIALRVNMTDARMIGARLVEPWELEEAEDEGE